MARFLVIAQQITLIFPLYTRVVVSHGLYVIMVVKGANCVIEHIRMLYLANCEHTGLYGSPLALKKPKKTKYP